jgi:hypothetical protein
MAQRLPVPVRNWLASRAMREHHAIWHQVRSAWNRMTQAERTRFIAQGWRPPRLNPFDGAPDPGAGRDFLFMHRRMIEQVNARLATLGDASYPRVTGWSPIPFDHADAEWPMPPMYQGGSAAAKNQSATTRWSQAVSERHQNDAWLRTVSLDAMGSEIENGIHNWLHMHWASEPWFKGAPGQDRDDPRNDYLGSTYSSHVNSAFWKLHGWIDDRIGQWERANGTAADWTGAWEGPGHHMHGPQPFDERSLLTEDQLREADRFFIRAMER